MNTISPNFTIPTLALAADTLSQQVDLAEQRYNERGFINRTAYIAAKIPQDQFVFCPVLTADQNSGLESLREKMEHSKPTGKEYSGSNDTHHIPLGATRKTAQVADGLIRHFSDTRHCYFADTSTEELFTQTAANIIVDVTHKLNDCGIQVKGVSLMFSTGPYGIADNWHRDGGQEWVATLALIGYGTEFRQDLQVGMETPLFKDSSPPTTYTPNTGHLSIFAGGRAKKNIDLLRGHIGALHRSPPIKEDQKRIVVIWRLSPPSRIAALSYKCRQAIYKCGQATHLIASNVISELAGSSSDDE